MDITTGWDFRNQEDRERALRYIKEEKPLVVIGSPMCRMFSRLQRLSGWNEKKEEQWIEAKEHIRFVVEIYREQLKGGRVFIYEHPESATSWDLEEIRKLEKEEEVRVVTTDQCMFGLLTWKGKNKNKWVPAKKPTRFLTNSEAIAGELNVRCDKSHEHQALIEGRAAAAARYPKGLCRAICRGIVREKKERIREVRSIARVEATQGRRAPDAEKFHEKEEAEWGKMMIKQIKDAEEERYWATDDLTGMRLEGGKVVEARAKEVEYIREKKVWKKIKRSEAIRRGWKIIKTRWLDIDKGDDEDPIYRSRLVGKEFSAKDGMDGIFAGTPPLEALRYLMHDAASVREGGEGGEKVVLIADVARAFFEAQATRNICVELPEEDKA